MKSLMTYCAAVLALAVITSSHAQERTAAGAMSTQMTWAALSAKVDAASTKTDAANMRIDQAVLCARKGMLYAPAAPGADSQGCVEAGQSNHPGTNVTSIVNSLNNLANALNTTTSNVNNVINCSKNGQVYNGGGCVSSGGKVHTVSAIGTATCPGGTVVISCAPSGGATTWGYSGNGCTAGQYWSKSSGDSGGWEGSGVNPAPVIAKCLSQ